MMTQDDEIAQVKICRLCGQPTCEVNLAEKYFPIERKGQHQEHNKTDDR